jgi:hypothetical protein
MHAAACGYNLKRGPFSPADSAGCHLRPKVNKSPKEAAWFSQGQSLGQLFTCCRFISQGIMQQGLQGQYINKAVGVMDDNKKLQ